LSQAMTVGKHSDIQIEHRFKHHCCCKTVIGRRKDCCM
jgi:hypothetical protein